MASDRGTAPSGAAPPPRGKTLFGLPRTAVIVGLVALVAGVGYIWYRNRRSSQQQASSATTGAAASAPGPCYDAAGNVVDCSDPSAVTGPNAATFQSEIQDLQGELSKAEAANAQQQTGQTEAETDVGQLSAEEQQLQKDVAALNQQERKEQKPRPGGPIIRRPGPRPGRKPPRRPTGPGQVIPGGPAVGLRQHNSRRRV